MSNTTTQNENIKLPSPREIKRFLDTRVIGQEEAKKIISVLGLELGYGIDVSVTSGDYKTKQIIADLVDQYISQKQKDYGDSYVKTLGMPVYLINKDILNIFTILEFIKKFMSVTVKIN